METHCDDGNTLRERERDKVTRNHYNKFLQEKVTRKGNKKR